MARLFPQQQDVLPAWPSSEIPFRNLLPWALMKDRPWHVPVIPKKRGFMLVWLIKFAHRAAAMGYLPLPWYLAGTTLTALLYKTITAAAFAGGKLGWTKRECAGRSGWKQNHTQAATTHTFTLFSTLSLPRHSLDLQKTNTSPSAWT